MFSKKEYSISKVTMAATSILIGIAASSLGTAYAQEDNNIKPTVEMKHNENATTIKPDMSKEHNELSNTKEVAPKSVEKSENIISKEDEILGEIIKEKFDWNTIDEKNFLNYLLSDIKADKSREREIKELWLVKINQLLITHANNENLIKIKAILEKDLASDNKKEGKDSEEKKDKKESEKESNKKEESTEKKDKDVVNNTVVANKVLPAKLLGRDVTVSFNKDKIDADEVFVGAVKDETLNNEIIKKLGNDYKIIETFEIHFEKDDKKVDSNKERTVKIAITKKNNTELEVYHIPNDNSLEKVNSKYSDGELQFNINHFSKFTIVERIKIGTKNLEERAQVVIPETTVDVKKEELPETLTKKINNVNEVSSLPKTGIKTVALEVVGVMLILAAILIRREQKKN